MPLAFLVLLFVWPVLAILVKGIAVEGAADLSAFGQILTKSRTWRLVGRTVGQATAATGICLVASVPLAQLLYKRQFRGQALARIVLTVPFVLPSVVVALAFRSLLGANGPLGFLGWNRGFVPVVLALVFFNLGLMVKVVGTFWASLDSRPEQAARVLGVGPQRALLTVTLPALAPALAAGASLVFLFSATAFGLVLILGGSSYVTVETEIYFQTAQLLNLRAAAVLSIVQLVVVAAALAFGAAARRRSELSLSLAVDSGRPKQPTRLIRPQFRQDWPALIVALPAIILVLAPMVNLVYQSLRVEGGFGIGHYLALGLKDLPGLPYSPLVAAGRSLLIAVIAASIALALGLALSALLSRRPRRRWLARIQGWFDALAMLPLGVSAVTIGFGFLIALKEPPLDLRTSFWLIPLAQALVALPLVVRTVLPALRAIEPRLLQAARVLGASEWRCFATVEAPVMARAAAVGCGYAFAVSLGEFGATAFLVRPETTTLPVAIYKLLGRPGQDNYGLALASAVLLAVITAAVICLAESVRQPRGAGR